MKKWILLLAYLLGTWQLTASAAPKEKKQKTEAKKQKAEEPKRVYMYGVAVNFNDSTTYLTEVQHLDSITINLDGALRNYASYSQQLKLYLEGTLGKQDQTCAVIYADKKKKLEKRYLKTRKRILSDRAKSLILIGKEAFAFEKR